MPGTVSAGQEGVAVAQFVNLGERTLDEVEIRFATVGSTLGEISSTFPGADCDRMRQFERTQGRAIRKVDRRKFKGPSDVVATSGIEFRSVVRKCQ